MQIGELFSQTVQLTMSLGTVSRKCLELTWIMCHWMILFGRLDTHFATILASASTEIADLFISLYCWQSTMVHRVTQAMYSLAQHTGQQKKLVVVSWSLCIPNINTFSSKLLLWKSLVQGYLVNSPTAICKWRQETA